MATKIYGRSDDLVEFHGDVYGETGAYSCGEGEKGRLIIINDGTLIEAKYGKPGDLVIWQLSIINKGPLFDKIEICTDEDAEIYSDIVYLKDGAKKAYTADNWSLVD